MTIFGIDFNNFATPLAITAALVVIIGMTIYSFFNYLKKQSELARINRELTGQITKLSNDLGKTREAYERIVNALDLSQQQVIFLQQLLSSFQKCLDNTGERQK
ncbi:hypothetical protein EDC14_1004128 [Hydrogenispora ethanolica]|jgi:hypothetical protein|uniref:Uncharacterized protein n=1 Tax=Hydrogenispora ethanolica TaxID=1082276 RepID=A0A4R1S5Y3_HYDET|nr:hypothetical protein [Hydrogenispora ethanolica]TCL74190.1 hypothetical protein EDC14_1004128 [Hydrogenispora ethanolica]